MKRRLTTSAVSSKTGGAGGTGGAVASRTRTAPKPATRTGPPAGEPRLVLASRNVWMHTLVLTGELDHRSAHALEGEIERLCEEGVTGITLDLRELTYVDSIGVAVIVFRCGHCRRRGYDFTLIAGGPLVQDAFAQAGVLDSLPFEEDLVGASPASLSVVPEPAAMAAQTGAR